MMHDSATLKSFSYFNGKRPFALRTAVFLMKNPFAVETTRRGTPGSMCGG
ncbi:MAG: hypothetical protein H6657_11065 [Ardenticatenaceae bacterium]|nr:hypothetical protein [Ardenticatenaceae bacterium]